MPQILYTSQFFKYLHLISVFYSYKAKSNPFLIQRLSITIHCLSDFMYSMFCKYQSLSLNLIMIWNLLILVYLLINVGGVLWFKRMLSKRLDNKLMVWLFSISLSLSINFLLALIIIGIYIRLFPTFLK